MNALGPRYSGLSAWMTRTFRSHPLSFPLMLLSCGAVVMVLSFIGPVKFPITAAIGFVAAVAGLGMLPFGAMTAIKRRHDVLVVRCPHCGMLGANAPVPFRVTRPDGVEYAYIVCSRCNGDFTVDRYARLG